MAGGGEGLNCHELEAVDLVSSSLDHTYIPLYIPVYHASCSPMCTYLSTKTKPECGSKSLISKSGVNEGQNKDGSSKLA